MAHSGRKEPQPNYHRRAMRAELDRLVTEAAHVTIAPEKVREVAALMRGELEDAAAPSYLDPAQFPHESPAENTRDTLQFFFVKTSQDFCIWRRRPDGDVEAWEIEVDGRRFVGARGISAALLRALRQGKAVLDPAFLASMTLEDVRDLYRDERTGDVTLQMLPERQAKLNEIGRVLRERYRGHTAHLLEQAEGYLFRDDGRGIVQQLLAHFPAAYRDWPFCKLPLLLGKFLLARTQGGIPTSAEFRALARIRDPENFEIAADYYIPLFFIRVGIFRISDDLARLLRERRLIERDDRMEQEYRACTIAAGRALAEAAGRPVPLVDTECWRTGYLRCRLCRADITDDELPCPYRERSAAYQSEHALMDLRWPLVLTTCY